MKIDEKTFASLPAHLQALFAKMPNPGSAEVLAGFPETGPSSGRPRNNGDFKSVAKGHDKAHTTLGHDDSGGSAARFFFCAKASTSERGKGTDHPTVKPVEIMRWLVRMVTPRNGHVLDPFAGSGSTGIAASIEQMHATLIEREPRYAAMARERITQEAGLFADVAAE